MRVLITSIFLLFSAVSWGQSDPLGLIRLHTLPLPDSVQVYITGSQPWFGPWDPGKVEMRKVDSCTWETRFPIRKMRSMEYKYTLGSWAREAVDERGVPFPNFHADFGSGNTIEDTVLHWREEVEELEFVIESQVTGSVQGHFIIGDSSIRGRTLDVWLPDNYHADDTLHYPVLYMQDGQNLFDPAMSSFGVDWSVDESCDSMIRNGAVEPMIVVGIHNTPDRSEEYLPGPKANRYMAFVLEEIKPFIDSLYRTQSGPQSTFVGGSSAGGTISFMLVWEHPEVFGGAICMSPAFLIQDIDYVSPVRSGEYAGQRFYIDNGGADLDSLLQPGVDAMLEVLKEHQVNQESLRYLSEPEARHSEGDWALRFPAALRWMLNGRDD